MFIGISGAKRHGKDEIAKVLVKDFGFKRIAIADKLKEICSNVFQIPLKCFNDDELKDLAFIEPELIDVYHIDRLVTQLEEFTSITPESIQLLKSNGIGKELKSPREILQFVGTDLCRAYVYDGIWLDIFYKTIKQSEGHLVCTDARYPNERKLIAELGGKNMLVVRPSVINNDNHSSENSLGTPEEYDIVVDNSGSLSDLHREVSTWYVLKTSK